MNKSKVLKRFTISESEVDSVGLKIEDLINIYERVPNKNYRISITLPTPFGSKVKKITQVVRTDLIGAVKRKNEMLEQIKDNEKYIGSNMKFSEFVDYWYELLDNKIRNGLIDENTVAGYKGYTKRYIIPYFCNKPMLCIGRNDVEKFIIKMKNTKKVNSDENYHSNTIAHLYKTLRLIFNTAVLENIIPENPCSYSRIKPTLRVIERNYFNIDELKEIKNLLEPENIRFRVAINLLIDSGIRREELCGLKWEDVDFVNNKIDINKAVTTSAPISSTNKLRIRIKPVKSKHSKRKIGIPSNTTRLLENYKNSKGIINDDDFIFTRYDSNLLLSPNRLTSEWAKFRKDNNIRNVDLHGLRHSHATFLLSLNFSFKDVARRMGHSIESLMRVYAHSGEIDDDKIVIFLEKEFK